MIRPRLTVNPLRSRADTSVVLTEDTDSFKIGDRVWVSGTKPGTIAYIGETKFAPGDWAGVVLDEPIGKEPTAGALPILTHSLNTTGPGGKRPP